MAKMLTVDEAVRERVLAQMKKYDAKIKAEVLKEAKKTSSWVRGVNAIHFKKLDLPTKKVLDLSFGKLEIDNKQTDIVVYGQQYDNGSSAQDSTVFKYSKDHTSSWHWELTAGVTFSYTAKAEIPEIASVSESVQINFSATYGEAASDTTHFEWNATVHMPPHEKTIVSAVLKQVAGTMPFTCKLIADGKVECRVDLDIRTWPDQTRNFSIPLQRLLSEEERTYTTTGIVVGASGIEAMVKKTSLPMSVEEVEQAGNKTVSRDLPDDLFGEEFSLTLD